MAALYLGSVQQAQPAGPYRLAGWSLGGVVAYEMARQLAARGERIELLALIDAIAPGRPGRPEDTPDDAELAVRFAGDWAGLAGVDGSAVQLGDLETDAVLARILEIGQGAGVLAPTVELRDVRRFFARFAANLRALATYRPPPYPGEVVLFRAGERRPAGELDATMGWGGLAGGLHVLDLPGDHYSLLRAPAVAALAAALRDLLR